MEAEPSIDECQCRVLQLMRDATAAGVVKWSEADQDRFDTVSGPIQSYIQFKWPSFNGDASSDRDFVEVEGVGRFMIGTPGYSLALEILGAGLDNWARTFRTSASNTTDWHNCSRTQSINGENKSLGLLLTPPGGRLRNMMIAWPTSPHPAAASSSACDR